MFPDGIASAPLLPYTISLTALTAPLLHISLTHIPAIAVEDVTHVPVQSGSGSGHVSHCSIQLRHDVGTNFPTEQFNS